MIDIKEKKNCCGCEACVQRCPKSCITMREDNEGFLYPEIDKDICIDCGLCEKVCPVINQAEERKPLAVYAAKHKDEQIRMASSSGGAFTAIAERVIDEGGVVFGAKFNQDWNVVHSYTETKEGLGTFRGSKYVQSRIGESYKEAEGFLKAGRKVLFSGTPCQIAGLKRFLRKEYDNLLTVDFICHGVPSPKIWREYLKNKTDSIASRFSGQKEIDVENIFFRDKCLGWKKYKFTLNISIINKGGLENKIKISEPFNNNIYLRGFLTDLYLRPSCHNCPTKSLKSGSDFTIGDFWGVQKIMPQIDDDKGVSIIIVNSINAKTYITKCLIELWPTIYDKILYYNSAIHSSAKMTCKRNSFWKNDGKSFEEKVRILSKVSHFRKIRRKIVSLFWK